jgi:hypothetical protein
MKYIKFCNEVLSVPENVTFWVMSRSRNFETPWCVNMSYLEKQNNSREPCIDTIIRSESYRTEKEAHKRLDDIFNILNSNISNEKNL